MSESKTLITHARTEQAQFLGYAISIYHADDKISPRTGTLTKTRSVNGPVRLGIPYGRVYKFCKRYLRNDKPIHEAALLAYSDVQIITLYQQRFRGVAEYYKYTTDRHELGRLKYVMEVALTKTLAHKFKTSVTRIYRKYHGTRTVDGFRYKTLQVEVPTPTGNRCVYWGAVPMRIVKLGAEPIDDDRQHYQGMVGNRTDLLQRMLANECELCGAQSECDVHHIRKVKAAAKDRAQSADYALMYEEQGDH